MILIPQFTPFTQSLIYGYILCGMFPLDAERHVITKDNFNAEVVENEK